MGARQNFGKEGGGGNRQKGPTKEKRALTLWKRPPQGENGPLDDEKSPGVAKRPPTCFFLFFKGGGLMASAYNYDYINNVIRFTQVARLIILITLK